MALRSSLLIVLVLSAIVCSYAQEKNEELPTQNEDISDVLTKVLKVHPREAHVRKKKIDFSVVPISSTAVADGNKVLVSSINIAFKMDGRDSTYLSSIFFLPYTNFYRNIGFGTKQ